MNVIHLTFEQIGAPRPGMVENALRTVPGVLAVRTDPAHTGVHVEATQNVRSDDLIAALQEAGIVARLSG